MFDVLVIGGGVVGTLILRELSKYSLKSVLLESDDDVGTGSSRANSGIVHAGYDAEANTKKAYFNVLGTQMVPSLAKELNVPFRLTGSLVVAPKDGLDGLKALLNRGIVNGVECSIIDRKQILELEPNIADNIEYALWAPTAGIISPYKLTIASADYAIVNGAEVKLNTRVQSITKIDNVYKVDTNNGEFVAKIIINCAGANCSDINYMVGEEKYNLKYTRGDYYLLDSKEGSKVNTVIFPLPDAKGKGILVAPTADGNVILGPTSIQSDRDDTSVTRDSLDSIRDGVAKTFKAVNFRSVIRLYSGMRTACGDDFIIKFGEHNPNYIMLIGICSPGLTASPAIAKYVVESMVGKLIDIQPKNKMIPLPKHKRLIAMTSSEINDLVKVNSLYGKVICRCERVSEAEIIEAIHSPLPASTVDAIKRRTRAGMGRCQGGFCMPNIIKIIARELNLPITAIKKGGFNSEIAIEHIKENKNGL